MKTTTNVVLVAIFACAMSMPLLRAQMTDNTQATSTSNAGINKSLADEIGAGLEKRPGGHADFLPR